MTQSIIDIGDAPNDGTGDPVREAFNKCNNNFTELYDATGSGAPLNSPAFTGNPTAPTPTAGDNDTSIATTAFVTAALAAGSSAGGAGPPQGRLTLQTATPVMTTTQSAKTAIYWTPYCGDQIPLYSGSAMVMTTFSELSVATTDTTKSPAAIGASKVNDWFVWSDAGTIRLGHGPDWTNDTTRSAGTALVMVNGIWLNNAAITNGPAASRGTYVGTTRSNASSQLDWIYGSLAATGGAAAHNIWNAYNRINVASQVRDSTDSWTLAGPSAPRAANNSATMRVSFVCGLAEDAFHAQYAGAVASTGGLPVIGVAFDTTTALSGQSGFANPGSGTVPCFGTFVTTALGFHFFQAAEAQRLGAVGTFYGDAGDPGVVQSGLTFLGRM